MLIQYIRSCPPYWRSFLHPKPKDRHAVVTGTHYSKNSSVNKEEDWNGSNNVPIYKKGDKTDCCKHRGISLFPATYKILSNILLSGLNTHAEEIIWDHQSRFRRNRSTTGHIFCIRQIQEKKWE
jgi:hypothetical protein